MFDGVKKEVDKLDKRVAQLKEKVKKVSKGGSGGNDDPGFDSEEGNE